ncbi:MAG TPA: ABC transporter ATP-binding protein [Firmicutes bacterium]|nr:ABC transporter ATP-binding protein [Bacillota bacterium]
MNAIEVNGISKTFRKWDSKKKKESDKVSVADGSNGQDSTGHWYSRYFPHRINDTALDNVSFNVSKGEIFGLLGPNGSGKSTLIRILSTLLLPDRGSVRMFGKDAVSNAYEIQRFINRVSVDAAFFKKLSARENLLFAARLYGVSVSEAKVRAKEILDKIVFEYDRYNDPLEDFSRGMQQKVAIARALLTSPVMLLLDEPTTGLDPKSKREVQAFVSEVRKTHDSTILLTTHDMDEADRMCDRIAIIDKGRIIALDTSEGLKSLVLKDLNGKAGNTTIDKITLEDVFLHLTGGILKREEDR